MLVRWYIREGKGASHRDFDFSKARIVFDIKQEEFVVKNVAICQKKWKENRLFYVIWEKTEEKNQVWSDKVYD